MKLNDAYKITNDNIIDEGLFDGIKHKIAHKKFMQRKEFIDQSEQSDKEQYNKDMQAIQKRKNNIVSSENERIKSYRKKYIDDALEYPERLALERIKECENDLKEDKEKGYTWLIKCHEDALQRFKDIYTEIQKQKKDFINSKEKKFPFEQDEIYINKLKGIENQVAKAKKVLQNSRIDAKKRWNAVNGIR